MTTFKFTLTTNIYHYVILIKIFREETIYLLSNKS